MDRLTPEKRRWNMSRIKGRDTKPELVIRSMLHSMGFRFKLSDKNLPSRPDIVLPKYKVAIFINGCFWHRHAKCKHATTPKSRVKFWNDKFEQNQTRDRKNLSALKKSGWMPITVWECEIKSDATAAVSRITDVLLRFPAKAEVAA